MATETPKESALRVLSQQRRLLSEEIKRLTADLEALRRAEDILSAKSNGDLHVTAAATEAIKSGYEKLQPQEATLKLLTELPDKLWKPSEVKKRLLQEGFKSKSDHLDVMVYSALRRLVKKGQLEKIEKDGQNFFKKKQ
jgi:hypothetical protein